MTVLLSLHTCGFFSFYFLRKKSNKNTTNGLLHLTGKLFTLASVSLK